MLSTYDAIAHEYFDRVKHPTCYNLRTATRLQLEPFLARVTDPDRAILEVGAGDSLVAEILAGSRDLRRLLITDATPSMLVNSEKWRRYGAILSRQDAQHLEAADESMPIVVSSLGDPYNGEGLWQELRRVLAPGGSVFFSTPSFEWAQTFRRHSGSPVDVAEFTRTDGSVVYLPSFVHAVAEQMQLIRRLGLVVTEVRHTTLRELPLQGRSQKLTDVLLSDDPVVTVFIVRRIEDENR